MPVLPQSNVAVVEMRPYAAMLQPSSWVSGGLLCPPSVPAPSPVATVPASSGFDDPEGLLIEEFHDCEDDVPGPELENYDVVDHDLGFG